MSLFSGGGGHNCFPSCLGEGHNFSQGFLGEGHIFLKYFIEKIYYEYPAAAGFRFLLILPLPSKKKISRRQKQKDLYVRTPLPRSQKGTSDVM